MARDMLHPRDFGFDEGLWIPTRDFGSSIHGPRLPKGRTAAKMQSSRQPCLIYSGRCDGGGVERVIGEMN